MNERIKELWRQAVLNNTKTPMNFQDAADEFAELIVRECAITVIDRCEMRNADDVRRAEYHAKRIKQHFGVEQ